MDSSTAHDEEFEILGDLEPTTRRLNFPDRIVGDSSRIRRIISFSSHITELNVVNSALLNCDLIELLSELSRLQTLDYTVSIDTVDFIEPHKHLKTIRLEADPTACSLRFVLSLMNACEAIEKTQVNLIGSEDKTSSIGEELMPALEAERWETLHTFVLLNFWSSSHKMRKALLEKVFHHKSSMGIRDWIQQNLKCFIYEHGNFNGADFVAHSSMMKDVELLGHSQYLNTDFDDGECPELHWGFPRALRVEGALSVSSIFHLAKNLSPTLVELDLTGTHGAYTPEIFVAVMASTSNLETLALPVCFFTFTGQKSKCFELFEKSAVRRIFIKGNVHSSRCRPGSCQCRRLQVHRCENCRGSLKSENLPNLAALENLRELTINGANMEDSAYERIANKELQVLRLCLRQSSQYHNLHWLLRRSAKLEKLKLQGLTLPVRSRSLWKSLTSCGALKQLCLGTRADESFPVSEIRRFLSEFRGQLEVIHLHSDQKVEKDLQALTEEYSDVLNVDSSGLFLLENIKDIVGIPRIMGRALCCPESRVGLMDPVGWKFG